MDDELQGLRELAGRLALHDEAALLGLEDLRDQLRRLLVATGADPGLLDLYVAVTKQISGQQLAVAGAKDVVAAVERAPNA